MQAFGANPVAVISPFWGALVAVAYAHAHAHGGGDGMMIPPEDPQPPTESSIPIWYWDAMLEDPQQAVPILNHPVSHQHGHGGGALGIMVPPGGPALNAAFLGEINPNNNENVMGQNDQFDRVEQIMIQQARLVDLLITPQRLNQLFQDLSDQFTEARPHLYQAVAAPLRDFCYQTIQFMLTNLTNDNSFRQTWLLDQELILGSHRSLKKVLVVLWKRMIQVKMNPQALRVALVNVVRSWRLNAEAQIQPD